MILGNITINISSRTDVTWSLLIPLLPRSGGEAECQRQDSSGQPRAASRAVLMIGHDAHWLRSIIRRCLFRREREDLPICVRQ